MYFQIICTSSLVARMVKTMLIMVNRVIIYEKSSFEDIGVIETVCYTQRDGRTPTR